MHMKQPEGPQSANNLFERTEAKIQDAANQIIAFRFFGDFEHTKKLIAETEFKTLEEYTDRTTADLEKVKTGVCGEYNALIMEIQSPNLTREEFDRIVKKVCEVTE